MNGLLSLLLVLAVDAPSEAPRILPAVGNDAGDAWVTMHAGSAWVCWSPDEPIGRGAGECWRQIELEVPPGDAAASPFDDDLDDTEVEPGVPARVDPSDPLQNSDIRFGFDRGRVWIAIDDQTWVLQSGQRQGRFVDTPAGPVTLVRPTRPTCAPLGHAPALAGGRLVLAPVRRCPGAPRPTGCLRPQSRGRKPLGLDLRFGITLGHVRGWSVAAPALSAAEPASVRESLGFQMLARIELGFDGPAALRLGRAREELLARERRQSVPRVEPSPLADAELDALEAIVCSQEGA